MCTEACRCKAELLLMAVVGAGGATLGSRKVCGRMCRQAGGSWPKRVSVCYVG